MLRFLYQHLENKEQTSNYKLKNWLSFFERDRDTQIYIHTHTHTEIVRETDGVTRKKEGSNRVETRGR